LVVGANTAERLHAFSCSAGVSSTTVAISGAASSGFNITRCGGRAATGGPATKGWKVRSVVRIIQGGLAALNDALDMTFKDLSWREEC
jgi:hypothetical protein